MTDHNGLVIRVRDAAARREAGHMSRADIDRIDRFRAALTGLGDDAEMVGRILTARFGAAALALRELQRQLETGPTAWDVLPKLSVTLYGVARSAATAASTR